MNKLAVLVVAMLAIGAYAYRDRLFHAQATKDSAQPIYTWKDKEGQVHYSSDKTSGPAHAKRADLPGISILESNKEELDKQAERLRQKEKPAESGDVEKRKPPEVRNLAIERMEKTAQDIKQKKILKWHCQEPHPAWPVATHGWRVNIHAASRPGA